MGRFVLFAWFGVSLPPRTTIVRPIRLIVTFPPGGQARCHGGHSAHLERQLGQADRCSRIGPAPAADRYRAVARSAPGRLHDRIGAAGALAASRLQENPYDPFTELAPISGSPRTPFLFAGRQFRANRVGTLSRWLSANPGRS